MAPLSRQAWEKGSVPVQVGVAPAGSSLTTQSPKSKAQAEGSPGEAQLYVPGVHTLPSSVGVPHRHSPKHTDPSVHSPVDAPQ